MSQRDLGDRIRKARKEKGMTQQQLGDLIGVSQVAISDWERGVVFPSKYEELAEVLDLSAYDLIATTLSDDPVVQAIYTQNKLSTEQRDALIVVYKSMLPRAS